MFYFVQYKPNKRERWHLVGEKQDLPSPAAFQTVLMVSADPDGISDEAEARSQLKYLGPMYFDLDGEDIDAVLADAVSLLDQLKENWGVDSKYLSLFLSGKKGVHITLPAKLFGVTSSRALLPLVWSKFADKFTQTSVDRGVYSLGKGRMWRTTGVKRPDTGTYKIQVTEAEMRSLNSEQYHELVKTARPDLQVVEPVEIPQLAANLPTMQAEVRKDETARKKATENSVTDQQLREAEGVPGCVQVLITDGDDPSSNWNQAAMQLAGYVGARYTRDEDDEYIPDLVDPFLDNVESSGRPDRRERKKSVMELIHKAFAGQVKFSAGGLINTTKNRCGNCIVCNPNVKETELKEEGDFYDEDTKLKFEYDRVLLVGENSSQSICNFGIVQEMIFLEPDMFGQLRVEAGFYRLFNQQGGEFQVELPESVFTDRRAVHTHLSGTGGIFIGTDGHLMALFQSLLKRRKGVQEMIRTRTSGILFHKEGGEVYPQLITKDSAFSKGGLPSKYTYTGPTRLSPTFDDTPDFTTQEEVTEGVTAIRSISKMNELGTILPALGWTMAAHLKAHLINGQDNTFPMLSVSGTSESGKSSTMFLLLALNAFPYRQAPFWNAEVDTIYPLEEMVSTSSTIIRMVEEANEHTARRNWNRLIGFLKSSWDGGDIIKGGLQGRNVVTTAVPNKAPIVYLSEQAFPIQSIRTRSVECNFSGQAVRNKDYEAMFDEAESRAKYLEMFAKVLATTALNTSISQVQKWMDEALDIMPEAYRGRTRRAYSTVLVGLRFLSYVMETYDQEFAEEVIFMRDQLVAELDGRSKDMVKAKRHSALDDILQSFDTMAAESENPHHGLICGTHYWAIGNILYLDLRQTFPRLRRYARGVGEIMSISTAAQVRTLIQGEEYFAGATEHPNRPQVEILMLNLDMLRDKGTVLTHFQEGAAD